MRIALIYLGRRGAGGWITFELAQQLQNQCSLLTVTSEYQEQLNFRDLSLTEQIITPTFHNAPQALLTLIFPKQINQLIQKISQHKPDVLLFSMFHPWNARIQAGLSNIPSVVFVHDPHPHPDLTGWFYGKLEADSIQQAERCIILSENLREVMLKRGSPLEKLDVIPIGLFRHTHPRSLNREPNPIPILLFFGRIVPYKGLEVLLQAYTSLRKTHQARLIIAGEGNLNPFATILSTLPDVDVINHWVPDSEIEELFSQSDLLVLPYTSASQSGVVPVAASFRLPVIATHTGGIPEQIEADVSGWLVQPGNVEELTNAIKEALNRPELARHRGEALHLRYESRFNWEKVSHQVADSLKKAVQARGQA